MSKVHIRFNNRVERSKEGELWVITGDMVKDGTKYLTVIRTRARGTPVKWYMRESDYLRTDYYRTFIPISGVV